MNVIMETISSKLINIVVRHFVSRDSAKPCDVEFPFSWSPLCPPTWNIHDDPARVNGKFDLGNKATVKLIKPMLQETKLVIWDRGHL
jgi:hypothetical protein